MRLVLAALFAGVVALGPCAGARADDSAEAAFWQVVESSGKAADLEAYLRAYPGGAHAAAAKAKLDSLNGAAAAGGDQGLVLPEDDTGTGAAGAAQAPAATGPRITTGKAVFAAFEPVTLSWSDLPQASYIKIDMQQDGRSIGDGVLGRPGSGKATLQGHPPGQYELVVTANNQYELARTRFTVAEGAPAPSGGGYAPELQVGKPVFAPFEPVTVSWKGLVLPPGLTKVNVVDTASGQAIDGQLVFKPSGSMTLQGRLPGDYEADLVMNQYVLLRQPFAVKAPEAQQAAAPAGATGLGEIQFADPPAKADAARFEPLIGRVTAGVKQTCGTREAYSWQLKEGDNPRIQQILAAASDSLKGRHYTLTKLPLDLKNAIVYKAVNDAAAGPDKALLITWYLEKQNLHLVLCTSS
jgi:hypothetical protein